MLVGVNLRDAHIYTPLTLKNLEGECRFRTVCVWGGVCVYKYH